MVKERDVRGDEMRCKGALSGYIWAASRYHLGQANLASADWAGMMPNTVVDVWFVGIYSTL